MVAVLVSTSSSAFDWFGLALALAVVGALGVVAGPRGRRLLIGLLVASVVAAGVTLAEAAIIPCPRLWVYLGLC